jgi:hypothetical protein
MFRYIVQIVKHGDPKDFQMLLKRWLVERTFA